MKSYQNAKKQNIVSQDFKKKSQKTIWQYRYLKNKLRVVKVIGINCVTMLHIYLVLKILIARPDSLNPVQGTEESRESYRGKIHHLYSLQCALDTCPRIQMDSFSLALRLVETCDSPFVYSLYSLNYFQTRSYTPPLYCSLKNLPREADCRTTPWSRNCVVPRDYFRLYNYPRSCFLRDGMMWLLGWDWMTTSQGRWY